MNYLEFFKEWSPYIASGLIVVLDVFILLLKRRPKTLDDFRYALKCVGSLLPEYINEFEEPGHGEKKFDAVFSKAIKVLEASLGRHLSRSEAIYAGDEISEQIESILSTPQKKGVSNEK